MAKVLYHGGNVDKIEVCLHCKSVISYDDSDVRHWTDSNGPGGCGDYHEYVDCPNCGRSVDIN